MFPYNDKYLVSIKSLFVRQFMSDIMFEIGAIYKDETECKLEIDWKALKSADSNMLLDIALEMREKISDTFKFSTMEKCQAGRLFAYYILGKDNKKSDEYIVNDELNKLYSLFLAFAPLNITYGFFTGVTIHEK